MIQRLFNLINIFGRKDSFIFLFVIFFTIISSFFEVIGIGILAVFALLISDPKIYLEKIYFTDLKIFLEELERIDLIIFFSISILLIFLLKHSVIFITSLIEIRITKKITLHLKEKIFKYYLSREYEDFLDKSKSDLINVISSQISSFMAYVHNIFMILKESILILIIFMSMMLVDWKIILSLTLILSFFSYLFIKFFKNRLNEIGKQVRVLQEKEIKHLDETYQSFKIIKLDGKENLFSSLLKSINHKKNYYEIIHYLIGKLPKIYLEILILIIFLGTVLFLLIKNPNNFEVLGTVTFFAIAIIRIMPAFISLNNGYTSLGFYRPSFELIYKMINIINKDKVNIVHEECGSTDNDFKRIDIINLSFSYKDSKKINLNNINLSLKKGDSLGIIGPSGSGKSTLLHAIIGLLKPNSGKISFDRESIKNNENYKKHKISYIPQDNFILNTSLYQNIAFGEKNIDEKKIKDSIEFSNLNDLTNQSQEKIDKGFGDSGSKLSHGQKQRIGLARAYYANSDLIIFDESLNALDHKNERLILKNISNLKNKILILVAHRTETLRYCNKLLILNDGKVLDFGITNDVIKRNLNLEKYFKIDDE